MKTSRLPAGGMNLFQQIKAKCNEAEAKGKTLYKLSIGQPSGPALLSARKAAAEAVMSDAESMHAYQDNESPGVPDFAKRFVQAHFGSKLPEGLAYLPIPGIKPMLELIPLACGAGTNEYPFPHVWTTTDPGYPTPAYWCRKLQGLGIKLMEIGLAPGNEFRFLPAMLDEAISPDLVMMNYPHNPSGQVATEEWLRKICKKAEGLGIRLFNDAAYAILSHTSAHCTLTEVAKEFPNLSWAEAFSASKVISNGCGWRVGAMVGSPDFIADIANIKGNADSGFAAPMAAGALYAIENDRAGVEACRKVYEKRLALLVNHLQRYGMKLAVEPGAGFFALFLAPTRAFGKWVKNAEEFNYLMIEETGVVGVHFHPYIRYSVTGDTVAMASAINDAFAKAQVSYESSY